MVGGKRDVIAGLDLLDGWEVDGVPLDNLFSERLGVGWVSGLLRVEKGDTRVLLSCEWKACCRRGPVHVGAELGHSYGE